MASGGSSTSSTSMAENTITDDEDEGSWIVFEASTRQERLPKFLERYKPSVTRKSDGVSWICVRAPVREGSVTDYEDVERLVESWTNITETGGLIDINSVMNLAKEHNVLCGKWLFYARTGPSIDRAWATVARAVASGQCGHSAKVSPSKEGNRMHVVCVYNNDFSDRNSVMNLEDSLRKAGIKYDLIYKPDAFTHMRIYKGNKWNLRPALYRSKYDVIQKASIITCYFL